MSAESNAEVVMHSRETTHRPKFSGFEIVWYGFLASIAFAGVILGLIAVFWK
jgi:hypothetical protein